MKRSTVESWKNNLGADIKTAEVENVPVDGESVLVRSLPARVSAEINAKVRLVQEGRQQVTEISLADMELLQFTHGVVEPKMDEESARLFQENYGPAFAKVVEKIVELTGVDEEATKKVEALFPAGGNGSADERRGELHPDASAPAGLGG